jgi:hypothetical protein
MSGVASWPMPREAEAREWWADVYEVRERIERRRARESATGVRSSVPRRRGVREVRTGSRLSLVAAHPQDEAVERQRQDGQERRRRPRPRPAQRIGPRPDRIAAWAVALGLLLLVLAILSSH